MSISTVRLLPSLAALLVLAACKSMPPPPLTPLDDATAIVERARTDPYVQRAGAVELQRAQQALVRAQASWARDRDEAQARHLAYLAARRGEIALAVGAKAQAEERVQQAGAQRESARLDARTREAERAAQQARDAQAMAAQQQTLAAQQQAAAEQARQRAASLERDLQSLQAKATDRGLMVTFSDVLFDTGRATLKPGAERNVQRLAAVLQQYPERRLLVEGYTDSVGSADSNLALSQRRADAFSQALQRAGVAGNRIEVHAHGEELPVASNDTPAGRQQNRRVEVLFSDGQGRFPAR